MNTPSFFTSLDYLTLNETQRAVVRAVHSRQNIIVSGGGRTGKTHLASVLSRLFKHALIIRMCDANDEFHPSVSFSAVFGTHMSEFQERTDVKLNHLAQWQCFIIDYASSLRPDELDRMDRMLQKARNSEQSFGGAQIVLLGDFCLPPSHLPTGEFSEKFKQKYNQARYAFEANVWQSVSCHVYTLTQYFHENGKTWEDAFKLIRLADAVSNQSPLQLESAMFFMHETSNKMKANSLLTHCCQSARLREKLNDHYLSTLPGRTTLYRTSSKGEWDYDPVELFLKPGMPVMFTREIHELNVFRGMLASVTRCTKKSVSVLTEYGYDIEVPLMNWYNKKITTNIGAGEKLKIIGERVKYPLVPAHAVMPHQIQGRRFGDIFIHPAKRNNYAFLYEMLTRSERIHGWIAPTKITQLIEPNTAGVGFSIKYGSSTQGREL